MTKFLNYIQNQLQVPYVNQKDSPVSQQPHMMLEENLEYPHFFKNNSNRDLKLGTL